MKEPLSGVLRVVLRLQAPCPDTLHFGDSKCLFLLIGSRVGNDFEAWGLLQIQVHEVPEFWGSNSTLAVTL